MTNLWNEISDTADLNRDGAVTLQELQVKNADRQGYRQTERQNTERQTTEKSSKSGCTESDVHGQRL